jgi:hypothetical protein
VARSAPVKGSQASPERPGPGLVYSLRFDELPVYFNPQSGFLGEVDESLSVDAGIFLQAKVQIVLGNQNFQVVPILESAQGVEVGPVHDGAGGVVEFRAKMVRWNILQSPDPWSGSPG